MPNIKRIAYMLDKCNYSLPKNKKNDMCYVKYSIVTFISIKLNTSKLQVQ